MILFITLFFTVQLTAQKTSFDAVYISHQPIDFGVGLRLDYHLGSVGLYNSLSYGDGALYRKFDMRDHYKATMGIRIPMRDYLDNKYGINIGINYHTLGSYVKENISWDTKLFNPWSFEVGISVYCWGKFALGIRTDVLRYEPCLDLGYTF